MFTAVITKKDFREGTFQVTVAFTNSRDTLTEAFNVTSEADLNNKIEDRLYSLNELSALENKLVLGEWVKPEKLAEPVPELTELQRATKELYLLKEKVDLGVIKETDPTFVDAVAAYKAAEVKE